MPLDTEPAGTPATARSTTRREIACTLMRGGTSKGPFFLAGDLPADVAERDALLLAVMGSPDLRQIDGLGGANPLTSKVAVVGPPTRPDADVDYLFLQVVVDAARVDPSQNCGNMLAGVAGFAVEEGLVPAGDPVTCVRIHMVNTANVAVATIRTPGGVVTYDGEAAISGVPGTAAPVLLDFLDTAGSSCGALLPTGAVRDRIEGTDVTLIDNGMPVIVVAAADLGITGREAPADLEANAALRARIEAIRLAAGPLMNLGDVARKTVPKVSIVAPPAAGGHIATRTFIPHRCHDAIGVLGAVSVASACLLPGSVAASVMRELPAGNPTLIEVEHPTGSFGVSVETDPATGALTRAALLRTARKLMRGIAFLPLRPPGAG
jgi:4-oxalomesaconate tautomerase